MTGVPRQIKVLDHVELKPLFERVALAAAEMREAVQAAVAAREEFERAGYRLSSLDMIAMPHVQQHEADEEDDLQRIVEAYEQDWKDE